MTETDIDSADAAPRRSRRLKNLTLLAAVVLSALVLLAWTSPWFTIRLDPASSSESVLTVTGGTAASGLVALALAGFALTAALAIAGPFFRVVLGVLQAFIGITVGFSAIIALADPVKASSAPVTTATGVSGLRSVKALVLSFTETGWPLLAAVLGILGILLGVFIIVTSRRWPGSSSRYQRVRLVPADEQGDEPSEGETTEAAEPAPGAASESDPQAKRVSDWDELSAGTDPTSR